MPEHEQLLTTSQACERLGVSRQRVSQLVASGQITPAMRLPAGDMLFTPAEIERFWCLPKSKGGRPQRAG